MKRIALSLSAMALVAAGAWGATGAFFSDTETSSANTFTAGAIDLTVDSQSHYAGLVCSEITAGIFHWIDDPTVATSTTRPELLNQPCTGTWTATNLGAQHQFFSFADVKPGDPGEDTVSLHLNGNPAWACMDIVTTGNNENSINEPEASAGDITPDAGELAQNLTYIAWNDNSSSTVEGSAHLAGDNIHQVGEPILFGPITASSLIGATTSLALADSTTGSGPFLGNSTNYVGIAWCAGTISVNGTTGAVNCDGSTMGNNTQTDSATSTVAFRVEQARNNATFTCGANTAGTVVVDANNAGGFSILNYDATTETDTGPTASPAQTTFVSGPGTPPAGTGSAQQAVGADGNDATRLVTSAYNGLALGSLTQIQYSTYVSNYVNGQAPTIVLRIDNNNDGVMDDRLFFEPVYQTGAYSMVAGAGPIPNQCGAIPNCVALNTWQTWDVDAGGVWTDSGGVSGPPLDTIAHYLSVHPTAKLATDAPAFRIQSGGGAPSWNNFVGNFDKLVVNGTTYNFGN